VPRRVNAVSPGVIEASWWDPLPRPEREEVVQPFAEQTPVRRNGRAEDVALLADRERLHHRLA
jgi:NAD(P)-dependent dehydrogenase (short-subunit alcohol dehydrogenase family)